MDLPLLDPSTDTHLIQRSQLRRTTYQRPIDGMARPSPREDLVYIARDHLAPSQSRKNVVECVKLLRSWPTQLPTTHDLIGMIQQWGNLEGCDESFDRILLTDMLNVNWTTDWGPLVNLCRNAHRHDAYRLTFLLSTISFGEEVNLDAVRCLIAFAILEELKALTSPKCTTYVMFKERERPRIDDVLDWLKPYRRPYLADDKSVASPASSHAARLFLIDLELRYKREQEKDEKVLAKYLLDQWPCEKPNMDSFTQGARIYLEEAISSLLPKWLQLYQNFELSKYLSVAQRVLDSHRSETLEVGASVIETQEQDIFQIPRREPEIFLLGLKLLQVLPCDDQEFEGEPDYLRNSISTEAPLRNCEALGQKDNLRQASSTIQELRKIIASTFKTGSDIRQEYSDDLMRSSLALQITEAEPHREPGPVDLEKLTSAIKGGEEGVKKRLSHIHQMLENVAPEKTYWEKQGALWPSTGQVSMLETLRSTSHFILPKHIRDQIVRYALSITSLQRMLRVEDALRKNHTQRLKDEQSNAGHSNWNPSESPDWLLLEIDANLLIRPGQVEVALATIEPQSSMNSVLQMNMGQGLDVHKRCTQNFANISRKNVVYHSHGGCSTCRWKESHESHRSKVASTADRTTSSHSTWRSHRQRDSPCTIFSKDTD